MSTINYTEKRIIQFDEPSHTYTDERGNEYTSATTLIGKYQKPFDRRYYLMWTALKRNNYKLKYSDTNATQHIITIRTTGGFKDFKLKYLYDNEKRILNISTDAVAAEWEHTTDIACDKGNDKHNFLEDEINKFSSTQNIQLDALRKAQSDINFTGNSLNRKALDNSAIRNKHPEIYSLLVKYLNEGWTIHAEKRVYSAYLLVAGMIDVLLTKGNKFKILDWKTNKNELHFEAGYYKKDLNGVVSKEWVRKNDTFLFPINNVSYCKGKVYTLQLSLYAHILELWGFECDELILCHIRDIPNGNKFGVVNEQTEFKVKFYDIKFLKTDIRKMLTHFIKTGRK